MSYRKLTKELHQQVICDPRQYKQIARDLGIHKDTVGRIKRQHQWEQINEQEHIQTTGTEPIKRSLARS